ncbi:MATE family efflux transporter [Pseudoalteromonas sp. NBT06-2]|uniref:MATE family efflux transporter n=1 Tax=Pseudoalteromonas sp. NBT06-2 TaxID=2025950 RepID=UPI000BA79691|nr:MATE family efflux transporter [Pseudoalteromonas sp. NBT06-2]PAJ74160.1 MATE family efflux transporter [Pseudoalteromonas sp. NBT06-2]
MRNETKSPDLLSAPIPKTIRDMTIPMIFGMVTLMLFNLVDTFFVSLLGIEPLAAISFTFPVTFTVISLAIGLSIGTSAIIAKALGSGNLEEARFDGAVALIISALFVSVFAFIGYLFVDPIFTLLGATDGLIPLIQDYMYVWFFGSIFLITPMIGNAVLRASGDTKTPSMIMGGAGIINAILDPIFIFGFGPVPAMGIQGAAIASVIAWTTGVFIILYLLIIKKKLISLDAKKQTFLLATKKMLKIGLPAAGANMLTPIAMAVMTALVAHHGTEAVAAFGVGSRIESISSIVVLALSMTLPPFISQNFGAGKFDRVAIAYKTTLKFIIIWQFAIYVLLIAFSAVIANIFASSEGVISVIILFIWVLPLGYGLQGVIILSNSSFNAMHKPMNALMMSVIRLFVFYIPFAYIGSLYWGIHGLFVGALIGNVFTAFISYRWFCQTLQLIESNNQIKVCQA